MVNKQEMLETIYNWFRFEPSESVRFSIGDDGKVNVFELEQGKGVLRAIHHKQFPNGKLPFVFGECQAGLTLFENGLTSLEGCPEIVHGSFVSIRNQLTNLVGGPKHVTRRLRITQETPLTNLTGFPNYVGGITQLNYHPQLPLLRTLNCEEGVFLFPDNKITQEIEDIIAKYQGQGRAGVFKCKKELIEKGFEGNARW